MKSDVVIHLKKFQMKIELFPRNSIDFNYIFVLIEDIYADTYHLRNQVSDLAISTKGSDTNDKLLQQRAFTSVTFTGPHWVYIL